MGGFFLALALMTSAAADTTVENLLERARERRIDRHEQWKFLLHYTPGLFGGLSSQADGRDFFLAPDGRSNSAAELEATLRGFFRTPTAEELAPPKALSDEEVARELKKMQEAFSGKPREEIDAELAKKQRELLPEAVLQHPVCRFPARLKFLKRELGWTGEGLPKIVCHRLEDFRRRLDAKSASLVFSSFYLSNPSSTFGHSFLRINGGLWSQYGNYRNELLDTGINFAAHVTVKNPILYPFLGMAGFYPGLFTAVPYYYKVREYNDFESRDLWSYDLALTSEELGMLVDHIWEEGSTHYDYFYFTENCSYHMFTLLDAAAPRFRLEERLPYYVIPSNTIRILNRVPGLVERVTYRPSVLSQFRHRLKQLNPRERSALDGLVRTRDPDRLNPELSKDSAARVLDTFSDQIELNSPEDLLKDGSAAQVLKQKVLVRRAALGVRSLPIDVPTPRKEAPELGHGMRRVSLARSFEADQGPATILGYKFAMHELLDPGMGYPRNMQIDFGQVRARYRDRPEGFRKKFEFDEIGIFKLTALTPVSRYYSSRSIRADLGWRKTVERDCGNPDRRCLPLTLDFAPGAALDPSGDESITLFAFLNARFSYTPAYLGTNVRLGAGPRLGALIHLHDRLRFMVHSEVLARVWAREDFSFSSEATIRWGAFEDWAVDLTGKRERDWSETGAQIHYYF